MSGVSGLQACYKRKYTEKWCGTSRSYTQLWLECHINIWTCLAATYMQTQLFSSGHLLTPINFGVCLGSQLPARKIWLLDHVSNHIIDNYTKVNPVLAKSQKNFAREQSCFSHLVGFIPHPKPYLKILLVYMYKLQRRQQTIFLDWCPDCDNSKPILRNVCWHDYL